MIDEQDIVRLKEIFVTHDECNETTGELKEEIHSEDKRLVAIETQLKVIIWLIAGVGGGVITVLVKMFFGG